MCTPKLAVLPILCLSLGINQVSAASSGDDWQYELTPYLLAASIDGTIGVHHYTADIEVSFDDLVDHLDAGFMGIFTAQKGAWLFALEGVYVKVGGGTTNTVGGPGGHLHRNGELDVTTSIYIAQGTAGYRLIDGNTKLTAFGALRYTKMKADMEVVVDFDPPPPFGGSRSADGGDEWVDAVAGLHVLHPLANKVTLMGYADIGGGGSDLTYQLMAGVNWEFSDGYTAKLGYRHLYWDYEQDGSVFDMTAAGPFLGLGIKL